MKDPRRLYGPLQSRETPVTVPLNNTVEVVAADTSRVFLGIYFTSTGACTISTRLPVTGLTGRRISDTGPSVMEYDIDTHGPLCGSAWYAFGTAAITLVVFEVVYMFAEAEELPTNQRGNADGEGRTQENDNRDNGYGVTPSEQPPYRANFQPAASRRLRPLVYGPSLTWRRDPSTGGFYPTDPDGEDRR